MSVDIYAQPRPKQITELPVGHLRVQVTYTPSVRLTDNNTVSLEPIYADDEPTYRHYFGDIEGSIGGHTVGDHARIVVTAKRLIICAYEFFAHSGEIVVVSIDREDLNPVAEIPSRKRNKPNAVAIAAAGVDLRITVPKGRTALLIAALQPEASAAMGAEAHVEREAKKRAAEEERLRGINEHAAEARRQREAKEARSTNLPGLSLGFLDHRKTWQYDVAASVDQCVQAFVAAFKGRGGLVLNGRWEIETDDGGATAYYKGRRGLMGLAAGLTQISQAEQDSAVGTCVRFTAGRSASGKTVCTLQLVDRGVRLGLTSDARFIRPHFHAVTRKLQQLDPELEVRHS